MKIFLTIILVILLIAGGWIFFSRSSDNSDSTSVALTWLGIHSLPTWATNTKVETKGGPATREFVITFDGTREQIESWIAEEPAFQGIQRIDNGNGVFSFTLYPKEGAQAATAVIDFLNGHVVLHTYWS